MARYKGTADKADLINHTNQGNQDHPTYWKGRQSKSS